MLDLSSLDEKGLRALQESLTPRSNKYIPVTPTPKQTAALLTNGIKEMLYGGAAGGGKSVFLLNAALQYVDIPNYSAILFRKTFSDLMLPGALIPMSQEWLNPFLQSGEVVWRDKDHRYTFLESGATLSFGYLDAVNDHLRYQGAEFQFIGFDECTQIVPEQYRYLFSRLRKKKALEVPLRVRATANPGGQFGEYYYQRFFVENEDKKRIFISAGLKDNPYLDAEAYHEALSELDDITRAQLEDGDWEIRPKGDLFDKDWILSIPQSAIPTNSRFVRFWDLASIDPKYRKKNTNKAEPDWTVGFKLGMKDGYYYITNIIKVQMKPGDIEKLIKATAIEDGYSCAIRIEEEGGSSGAFNIDNFCRKILPGYDIMGVKPVVSKIERARPVAAACQCGNVFIGDKCMNTLAFFTQINAFPSPNSKDDIVDGFSGAFTHFRPTTSITKAPEPIRDVPASEGSFWRSNSMANY